MSTKPSPSDIKSVSPESIEQAPSAPQKRRPSAPAGPLPPPIWLAPRVRLKGDGLSVQLVWSPVGQARSYELELAGNADFEDPLLWAHIRQTRFSMAGLPVRETIYWRVRSADGDRTSDWSPAGFWGLDAAGTRPAPETVPTPEVPVGAVPTEGGATTFTWRPVDGAEGYRLQVARDASFASVMVDVPAGSTTSLTFYSLFPEDGSVLYWRVGTEGPDGSMRWSVPAAFQSVGEHALETYKRAVDQASAEEKRREARKEAAAAMATDTSILAGETSALEIFIVVMLMLVSFGITFYLLGRAAIAM